MTKIISLSDEIYEELSQLKQENESFTKLLKRFIEERKRRPLMDFFGKWPGDSKEIDSIKDVLRERRKTFKTKEISF